MSEKHDAIANDINLKVQALNDALEVAYKENLKVDVTVGTGHMTPEPAKGLFFPRAVVWAGTYRQVGFQTTEEIDEQKQDSKV